MSIFHAPDLEPVELYAKVSAADEENKRGVKFFYSDSVDHHRTIVRSKAMHFSVRDDKKDPDTFRIARSGTISFYRSGLLYGLPESIKALDSNDIYNHPERFYKYIGEKLTHDLGHVALIDGSHDFFTVIPRNIKRRIPRLFEIPQISQPSDERDF